MKFRLPRKKKKQLKKMYFVAVRSGRLIRSISQMIHHSATNDVERKIWRKFSYESQKQNDEYFFKGFQNIINQQL